ncbi:phosphotransferase [Falsiruegeria mediterranea]|uniref:Aminoglycoside phosphotransferase domain-containing protein n=1 Tax=Falsiruegeria mediterranea M17 TaxID=1200281 RepID=A0A2R8CB06_9RHOB|nr:phosphotransferase [Falsiruegeria mediterranea]SPJ29518.1 hypothetical protein TRM7615_03038 [Falsiruegeria mediterranea M17]
MLDLANEHVIVAPPWRDRVNLGLKGKTELIARAIARDTDAREMTVSLIKQSARSVCAQVDVGERSAFLKLFDGAEQADQLAYKREKISLLTLRDSALVPRLLAFSDPGQFIITEWIGKGQVRDRLERLSAEDTGDKLGRWLARYDAVSPAESACGNWYSYLNRFGAEIDLQAVETAQDLLLEIPLCGRSLARNDAALGNFMLTHKGDIIACDFEAATMRPRGWDYLQLYRALILRFADRAADAVEAFADGYAAEHKGALIADELNVVARILFCAEAVAGRKDREALAWL